MKLIKKLLPITAALSTAAIVAPIATSCGVTTFTYNFDINHLPKDFKHRFQIAESEQKKVKAVDATDEYLKDIARNKAILADELVWNMTHWGAASESSGGTIIVKVGSINKNKHKVSVEMNADLIGLTAIHLSLENVEYVVTYRVDQWYITPMFYYLYQNLESYSFPVVYLQSNQDWSCTLDVTIPTPSGDKVIPYKYDYSSSVEDLEELVDRGTSMFFRSYYWQYVELDEEK